MTDLSRGLRSRRGGRRPGWLLLTVLLVLAIAASSALVFTEQVELLKLAVILALWAAVAAAFVSVIYRRQSDMDRARARDLKLVYDLQLDREISARREYELEVESQLRRELSSELRDQAAEEVASLRAELAALRNNLEMLFDADLSQRPALETERTTVRAYSDWQRDTDPGRGGGPRFVASAPPHAVDDAAEDAIIDVPEEPAVPDEDVPEPQEQPAAQAWVPPTAPEPQPGGRAQSSGQEWQPIGAEGEWLPPGAPGSHWVSTTNGTASPQVQAQPSAEEVRGRHSVQAPSDAPASEAPRARHGASEAAGQSVAELLARFQSTAGTTGGGRRRRRED
jgi:hypothetical protein